MLAGTLKTVLCASILISSFASSAVACSGEWKCDQSEAKIELDGMKFCVGMSIGSRGVRDLITVERRGDTLYRVTSSTETKEYRTISKKFGSIPNASCVFVIEIIAPIS